ADDAGDQVGDEHGWAGVERRRIAGPDEDARADDASDTEEHEVPRSEGPLELAGPCFFLNLGNALAQHHAPEHSPWSGSRHPDIPSCGGFVAPEPSDSASEGNPSFD